MIADTDPEILSASPSAVPSPVPEPATAAFVLLALPLFAILRFKKASFQRVAVGVDEADLADV